MVLSDSQHHEDFWNQNLGPWLLFIVRSTIYTPPDRISKIASDASDLDYPLDQWDETEDQIKDSYALVSRSCIYSTIRPSNVS